MAAEITFYAGENEFINNLSGSGLGFYGPSFGRSVAVGANQQSTFITNGAGTDEGPQVDNDQFIDFGGGPSDTGVSLNGLSPVLLTQVPNFLSTLNIRFTNDVAVIVQNAQLRIFDRVNINNPASGVTTKVAEIIHPDIVQVDNGSGDIFWQTPAGSSVIMSFVDAPGISGLSPAGPNTTDSRHDWYAAISASPDSIGSKTQYGLSFSLEFL